MKTKRTRQGAIVLALMLPFFPGWAMADEEDTVWNIDGMCVRAIVTVYEDFSRLVERHRQAPTPELQLLAEVDNYVWRVSRDGSICTLVISPDFARMPVVKGGGAIYEVDTSTNSIKSRKQMK